MASKQGDFSSNGAKEVAFESFGGGEDGEYDGAGFVEISNIFTIVDTFFFWNRAFWQSLSISLHPLILHQLAQIWSFQKTYCIYVNKLAGHRGIKQTLTLVWFNYWSRSLWDMASQNSKVGGALIKAGTFIRQNMVCGAADSKWIVDSHTCGSAKCRLQHGKCVAVHVRVINLTGSRE